MKLVVFRSEASPEIGAGHIMRCLSLADKLAEKDWISLRYDRIQLDLSEFGWISAISNRVFIKSSRIRVDHNGDLARRLNIVLAIGFREFTYI